jgi:hypothetical protein
MIENEWILGLDPRIHRDCPEIFFWGPRVKPEGLMDGMVTKNRSIYLFFPFP